MEFIAKSLLGRLKIRTSTRRSIHCKNRRPGKTEEMVILKCFRNRGMHFTELRPMTFIKNQHHMAVKNCMSLVAADEPVEFLNGSDDNAGLSVFQLSFQYRSTGIAIGRTFFKLVVFPHGLIIKVFAVHNKKHLVDRRQFTCELGGFETRQSLARAGGMPNVTARRYGSEFFIVRAHLNPVQYSFRCHNLIRAHYQKLFVSREHAVAGEDIKKNMFGKKGLGKIDKISNRFIGRIRPPACEFEAVTGPLAFL